MSELTTGAVSLSAIGAPLAAGAACINAASYAARFLKDRYQSMMNEIEAADVRLNWMDEAVKQSPVQIATQIKSLAKEVALNPLFVQMTSTLKPLEKENLAGFIAAQKSPASSYLLKAVNDTRGQDMRFDDILSKGVTMLAKDNLQFVTSVVMDAARATGFNTGAKVLKANDKFQDLVFTDTQGRRLSAFCKLDKELNPSLALDLEGFSCSDESCSQKMNELVAYLQEHGVPFKVKRLKHNQPEGVLRKVDITYLKADQPDSTSDYLNSTNPYFTNPGKQKS